MSVLSTSRYPTLPYFSDIICQLWTHVQKQQLPDERAQVITGSICKMLQRCIDTERWYVIVRYGAVLHRACCRPCENMPIACHNALSPLPKKVSKTTATVSIQNLPAGLNLRKTVLILVTAYPEVSPMEGSMPHAQRVLPFLLATQPHVM